MYAFFAFLTLALAALAQVASAHLADAVKEETVAALRSKQMRSVKLGADGNLHLKYRDGDEVVTINDTELHSQLKQTSTTRRAIYGAARSVGFSRINPIIARDNCALLCQDESCSTSTTTANMECSCLKDCGPEGEECFSTCFSISRSGS